MEQGHTSELLVKQGKEWSNEEGETFPAIPLYRAVCSCGWQGAAWYGNRHMALGHHERHVHTATAARRDA